MILINDYFLLNKSEIMFGCITFVVYIKVCLKSKFPFLKNRSDQFKWIILRVLNAFWDITVHVVCNSCL